MHNFRIWTSGQTVAIRPVLRFNFFQFDLEPSKELCSGYHPAPPPPLLEVDGTLLPDLCDNENIAIVSIVQYRTVNISQSILSDVFIIWKPKLHIILKNINLNFFTRYDTSIFLRYCTNNAKFAHLWMLKMLVINIFR